MKRFFCKICNKVKRVRVLPRRFDSEKASRVIKSRIGICDRHPR
jgi:hypothetical protein